MKITKIELHPISQVVRPEFAIVSAAGAQPESHYIVVAIRSDEGQVGYGEATVVPGWSGETQATARAVLENCLIPVLMGRNPLHVRAAADALDRVLIENPFTKAAVEMALLDLAGKALGVPVHILLGGPRRSLEVTLKFSIGAFPPAEAARVARAAKEMGLKAVKVKVALGLAGDVARLEAVREAVGDDFRVAVDANGGWLESDALAMLPHLERLRVNCIEQPFPRGDFRSSARLRKRTLIPLMLDEGVFTRQQALEAIRTEACDIISIYPGKNGGLLRSLEIAQLAATAGLRCTIGSNLEMDLGTSAMLHVAVAAPNLAEAVDHDIIGPLYYDRHFTRTPIQFRNGCAVVPGGPGLGVDFEAALTAERQ